MNSSVCPRPEVALRAMTLLPPEPNLRLWAMQSSQIDAGLIDRTNAATRASTVIRDPPHS